MEGNYSCSRLDFTLRIFLAPAHLFVPTFLLLVCIGLFFIRIDRFVICAFSAGLTFLAMILTHIDKLVDIRYYLPLLILLVAVAVLPVTWAAQNILAGRRVLTAAAVFVLFGAACLWLPFALRL